MKPSTVHRRRQQTIGQAVISMYNGMSVRQAAATFRLPKSTVHDAFYAPITPRVAPAHRRALSDSEEKQIVSLLIKHSDQGVPLTTQHVQEAVRDIVRRMSVSRRISLPFKDGSPGQKFFRGFLKRHKYVLQFIRPLKQEYDRFKAVIAQTLCQHFCTLEKLVSEHDLDAGRVWNLDECGVTPGRDANGRSQRKRFVRRNGSTDVCMMPLSYDKRVTLMPVVSAAGETGPCLFVFKGKCFPYRVTLVHGREKIDSVANHLPRKSVVTMREEGGGVDQHNFKEWAYHFVVSVRDLTRNGKKVLLIYDGYRSHMSLAVLKLFAENNIVVYALPSHSSGKTQPLDVVLFSSFKRKLNELMYETTGQFATGGATVYDLCDLMHSAYNATFNHDVIRSAFLRAGVWPVDGRRLMDVPRPANQKLESTVGVEEMEQMMEKRRAQLRNTVYGEPVSLLESGYIDTTKGAVLNSVDALKMVEERVQAKRRAKAQAEVLKQQRQLRAAERQKKESTEATRMKNIADVRRAVLAGMDVDSYRKQVRSMGERRAQARLLCAEKRASQPPKKHISHRR